MSYLENLFNLNNKTIIITGAGSGNGKTIAIALSKLNCKLIICDNNKKNLLTLYKSLNKINSNLSKYIFDLKDLDQIKNFIKKLKSKKMIIDVLINNAGISLPSNSSEYPIDSFDETYKINLRAPFILSTRISTLMKKSKLPTIINITSLGAHKGFPNNIAYTSSKGALRQMTKSLAYDLSKYNIRVNSVCPGYIKTKMTLKSQKDPKKSKQRVDNTLLKRWGESKDLIGAIIYLSSDASSYVTGTEIIIDGGWLSKGL